MGSSHSMDTCKECVSQGACSKAVLENTDNIKYAKDQTDELVRLSIRKNPTSIRFIRDQKKEWCVLALDSWGSKGVPSPLRFIKEQTDELIQIACAYDKLSIIEIKNPTLEICEKAIKILNSKTRSGGRTYRNYPSFVLVSPAILPFLILPSKDDIKIVLYL